LGCVRIGSDEKIIVDKSNAFYGHRVMELFDIGIARFIHLNDPLNKWIFYNRSGWFLSEMQKWLFLLWYEKQICDNPEFYKLCPGELAQIRERIESRWRDWLSEESWKRFFEARVEQKLDKSLREAMQQEPEEDEEEEEEELEREAALQKANDAKTLREKCPGCAEKCKEYFERRGDKKRESAGR
jgi:hypothetical protein